ncbi:MAG: tetratricopeptide repeat protein [Nannocystales bacterium]
MHVLDKEAVDDLLRRARALAGRGRDPAAAHAMFTTVLRLDPVRLEAHIDLVQLEVQAGNLERARKRMERLSEEYSCRSRQSNATRLFKGSDGWEEEFSASWDDHLRPDAARSGPRRGASIGHSNSKLPPPPTKGSAESVLSVERREELLSRYSVRTLRARAMVRRDPSVTRRESGTSLAHSLRKLARGASK